MVKQKRFTTLAALLWVSLPFAFLSAQDEGADGEEIFELSPFEVSTDSDIGYYATSSMAGTRINTQLRDIASSVQVVTEEFMDDVGATDLDSLMQYTTSSETAGIQGNFVGYESSNGQTSTGTARENIGLNQRIRGLGNPDKTRDFYKTLIAFDSYNTSRVDINRGANSFLFGLGSPAGLINANLKKAVFRDLNELSFRIGEGGDDLSTRAEVDFNRVLVDDVLAVRVAAVYDDKNFRQRPTFARDKRIYGTVTYKPFKRTTIRAHYEQGDFEANPSDVLLPQENLSMFLDAPDGFARLSIDVVDNIRTHGNPEGPVEFRVFDRLRNWHSNPQSYHFIWDGLAENSNNEPAYARINGIRGGAARFPTKPEYWNGKTPWLYYVKHGNFMDYQPNEGVGWIQRGFINLDTFDFSKYNMAGNNDFVQRDFKNYNISLEQLLLNGKAGFEIGFDRQEYESESYVLFQGGAEQIFFDINETLLFPDPAGDGMTPMPNPNYGRPAIMTQNHSPLTYTDQDALRFSGFIKHDFRDNVDGFLGTLLGRHQVTALIDRVSTDSQAIGRRYANYVPEGIPDDMSTSSFDTTQYARQLFQTVYIGPPQLNAFTDPNFTLADFQLYPISTAIPQQERTLPVTYWNVLESGWDETTVTGRWVPSQSQKLSEEQVTSTAFNTQSHLLNDLIVVNLGWREDEVKQKLRINETDVLIPEGGDTVILDPEIWNLNNTPSTVVKNEIFGYGFVLNMPRKLLRLPDWFDMSLHYNESENFVPAAGLQDYLGNRLPSPTGESKDYGFTLYLFDSKLVARVNWFEGALANTGSYSSNVNNIVVDIVNTYGNFSREIIQVDADGDRVIDEGFDESGNRTNELLARTYEGRDWLAANIDPLIYDMFTFSQNPDGSYNSSWAGSNTTDLHDNTTEGIEIEIVANPMPNWRVSLSVSKYETVLDNIAPRLTKFIDTVSIPFVQQFGDLYYGNPSSINGSTTVAQEVNSTLFEFYEQKAAEGTPALEQREWSWRLVTNYTFRHGALKGFSVGGAYRWEDGYAYGYPLADLNGIIVPDIHNPYVSDPESFVDLWFGYRRKIFNNSVDWNIRLNIRNVNNWDSDNVSVIRVQPDGSPARARFDPPREIFLTSTFKF